MIVKWDPLKLTFFYYMHQHFMFFVNIGLGMIFLRPKLVANNRIIIIKYTHTVVSDEVYM